MDQSYFYVKNTQNTELMGNFIAGYVEGEGCFCLATHKNKNFTHKVQFMPSFTIQVHIIDLPLIKKIKSTFQCGRIYYNKRDNTINYKVYRLNDLKTKIIPFFDKYRFQGNKKKSFDIFKEIIDIISKNKYLSSDQVTHLYLLKEKMNRREDIDFE